MYEGSQVKVLTSTCSLALHGHVLEFKGDSLHISCGEIWTNLECNTTTTVAIYDDLQGKILYSAVIDKVYKEHILFSKLRVVGRSQERHEVRAKVSIPVKVSKLIINNHQELELDKIICMEIRNLSASGALLSCNLSLPVQLGFEVLIRIDYSAILAQLQIVRKEQCSDSNYAYGCKFINICENDAELIRQFVFKHQIIKQKKKKQQRIQQIS